MNTNQSINKASVLYILKLVIYVTKIKLEYVDVCFANKVQDILPNLVFRWIVQNDVNRSTFMSGQFV